ncbi:SDR family NAD(P)-dependent oxidoreductase [Albimonas sp. CAU 1670]|uniref:SDR family oxidoreductase n=1 Tax=Albimonas sp. CAU 1670 TaxID=3032599 RepID=UPI0023DA7924|nr:SDR family NAD(P)-dependent oxidoreductase [Albimonas sp. CAU 1670]MDF2231593.1 SDR family NAD(P)-dependent oxidoreductase [Albimonas sp. CAU 1670]
MTLAGRTVWITGAASGIGAACAQALAAAGARLALSDRDAGALDARAAALRAEGAEALALPLDVTDALACRAAVEAAEGALGPVEAMVAAAGINLRRRTLAELDPLEAARVMDVNVDGVVNATLAVLPGMRARGGGALALICSWAGRHVQPFTGAAYNASKQAVAGFCHTVNMEEGANGVRACAIMPGEVSTPLLAAKDDAPTPGMRSRMLQPADVARAVRFALEQPAHVCVNEILVSPTWNRLFVPPGTQAARAEADRAAGLG